MGLLPLLLVAWEHFRGSNALERRVKELSAHGEVFSVAKLEPRHPAPEENIFTVLSAISNQVDGVLKSSQRFPPILRFAMPGKAVVSWRLASWGDDEKTTNNWTEIAAALAGGGDVLPRLQEASRRTAYDSGFNYRKGFADYETPPVVLYKKAVQLLRVATLLELSRGNDEAARKHLHAMIALVVKDKAELLLISQMLRQTCAVLSFATTWQALQSPGWNDDQLADLQSAWADCDFIGDIFATLEMERAMTLDLYTQVKSSSKNEDLIMARQNDVRESLEDLFGTGRINGTLFLRINVPLWRVAWADQDELRSLNEWQGIIEHARRVRSGHWVTPPAALDGGTQSDFSRALDNAFSPKKLSWRESYNRFRFIFSGDGPSVTANTIRAACEAQTLERLAVTAIALKRYQLRSKQWPPRLDDLVPGLLLQLPIDPMDGRSLRYHREGQGFNLYSVGRDGRDDGGDATRASSREEYTFVVDGRDMVWPVPATDAEAAEAMKPGKRK